MNKNLQPSSPSVPTVSERIIAAAEPVKIRELGDPYPLLNGLLTRLLILHNIKGDDKPDAAYQKVLVDGLAKYHGNWTVEEIYLGCELNIHGKLQSKVEWYGRITADYISAVLHLYSEEKKATILKSRMKSAEKSNLDLNRVQSPEAMYQAIVDFVKVADRLPDDWDWHLVYDYLTEHRLIEDWTPAKKRELKERMEERVKAEQAKGRMTSIASIAFRDLSGKDFHDRVVMECKKFIVLAYLKKYLEHKS